MSCVNTKLLSLVADPEIFLSGGPLTAKNASFIIYNQLFFFLEKGVPGTLPPKSATGPSYMYMHMLFAVVYINH